MNLIPLEVISLLYFYNTTVFIVPPIQGSVLSKVMGYSQDYVAVHFRGRSIVFFGMDGFCEIPHFRLSEG
jgi:hypothetical protein